MAVAAAVAVRALSVQLQVVVLVEMLPREQQEALECGLAVVEVGARRYYPSSSLLFSRQRPGGLEPPGSSLLVLVKN
jgi:hypothetical protein